MPVDPDKKAFADLGTPPGGPATAGPDASQIVLGDYELGRELGRGGMGTVYLAWQRSLQRTVALKVLSNQISASPVSVQRFQREAQAAAKLQHTHITSIFAQGEDNGVYYYTMEFIDGPSLFHIISSAREAAGAGDTTVDLDETVALEGREAEDARFEDPSAVRPSTDRKTDSADSSVLPGPVGDADSCPEKFVIIARHMASVAAALDYAHKEGVIHRDIKPHNLLIGSDDRMRITDFGLARVLEQPGVTMTGEMLGSPLYMSPEQIRGGNVPVDHRTDVYSLGATMYEWLTLQPPHPGDSREQVITKILNSEPQPLRDHDIEIPVDLETICLKAIEHGLVRRYRTAGELRDDLNRFLESRPIKARRTSASTRLGRFLGRHQVAALGTLAAVVAALLLWLLHASRSEVETSKAEAENATAAAVEAEHEIAQLFDILGSILPAEIGGPLSVAGAAVPVVQGLVGTGQSAMSSSGIARPGGANPAEAGTPEGIIRRAARDFYEVVTSNNPDPEQMSENPYGALYGQAIELWSADNAEDALTLLNAYLEKRPDDFEALEFRTAIYAVLGRYSEMAAEADALVRLGGDNPSFHVWRGLAYLFLRQLDVSLAEMQTAAASPEIAAWGKALAALVLVSADRPTDAIAYLDDALSSSPGLVVALLARSTAYAATGDYELAIEDITRVIEAEPNNADALAVRGQYYGTIGEFGAAANDLKRAMDIAGRSPEMSVQFLAALYQQRKLEVAAAAAAGADETETAASDEVDPEALDASKERVQQWFSHYLWPGSPQAEGQDSTSPSLAPEGSLGGGGPQ